MNKTRENGDTKSGEFKSPDLYYSAYLQVAGVPMLRTESKEGRVFFVFDTTLVSLEELKQAWFNNTAKVPPLQYANMIKSLKSRCHMENR